ncbi:MAG: hypothetical protein WCB49_03065 [Gammaproteobacteria bacterium]
MSEVVHTAYEGDELRALDWGRIARDAEENCAHALKKVPNLPPDVSLEAFIRTAADVGPLDHYKYFDDAAKGMIERIGITCGAPAVRAFLRAALGRTISIWVDNGRYQRLPPLCAQYHAEQLERIAHDPDVTSDWLDLGDDRFQKEFGITLMRLYVAGSHVVDPRCGISRSTVLREGLGKALPKIGLIMRLGGFKPYLQSHLHTFHLEAFNEEGRKDFYHCCTELYSLHPQCLGVFSLSWYYDPVLEQISPWLAYLRKVPLANGAHLWHVQDGGQAIIDATAKSKKRRKLYEEGKYLPRTYMLIWGRKEQIEWARAHPRAVT